MLIETSVRDEAGRRLRRMIEDDAIPVAVESGLVPLAGQLDLGLGTPLTPIRFGLVAAALGAGPGALRPAVPNPAPAAAPAPGPAAPPATARDGFDATIKLSGVTLGCSTHVLKTYFPEAMAQANPTLDCLQVIIGGAGVYSSFMKKGVSWDTSAQAAAFGADLVAALGYIVPALAPVAPHAKTLSLVVRVASTAREAHIKLA